MHDVSSFVAFMRKQCLVDENRYWDVKTFNWKFRFDIIVSSIYMHILMLRRRISTFGIGVLLLTFLIMQLRNISLGRDLSRDAMGRAMIYCLCLIKYCSTDTEATSRR